MPPPQPQGSILDPERQAGRGQKTLFGVRRKALIFSTLFLILVNSAFSLFLYYSLSTQFERQRDLAIEQDTELLEGLLNQSARHLLQTSELLPRFQSLYEPQAATAAQRLVETFEQAWPTLQLDLGLDLLRFYADDGALVSQWQGMDVEACAARVPPELIERVNAEERPQHRIDCQQQCVQMVFTPTLVGGEHLGVTVLGRSLAENIVNFKAASGRDLAILRRRSGCDSAAAKGSPRYLSSWDRSIWALTDAKTNLPILRLAAERFARLDRLRSGVRVTEGGRTYGLQSLPVAQLADSTGATAVIVEDITDQIARIQGAVVRSVAVGVGGLIVSAILVSLMLWGPIARLRRAAHLLPMLSGQAFDEVRKEIGPPRGGRVRDEFDILDGSVIDLTDQLEALRDSEQTSQRMLQARMEELAMERDFLSNLMDNAQGVVMVLDDQLRVRAMNPYAELVTGFTEDEFIGNPFTRLLPSELVPIFQTRLGGLVDGTVDKVTEEFDLSHREGEVFHMAWVFTAMASTPTCERLVIAIGLDITARKQAESRLAWLATHDSLTDLLNRTQFHEKFTQELRRCRRVGGQGALFYIDIDNFKYINDSLGQKIGDRLLEQFSRELEANIRRSDLIARLGGDEFAVLLPEVDEKVATLLAGNIVNRVQVSHYLIGEHQLTTSISLGIALYPRHGDDAHELLATADTAMYQAKRAGGGQFHVYSPERDQRERARHRRYWDDRIRHALHRDDFLLHFQPIQALEDGDISHYEVLVRMRDHDSGRLVMPGEFIPAAERSGQILEIDQTVVRKALERLVELEAAGEELTLAINLSGGLLHHENMHRALIGLFDQVPARPERVIFELTETAAVSDLGAARQLISSIRELGCRFALDDFGTGFSSFFYLRELPFDFVKIDGSFIRNLPEQPDDQTVVRALVDVARGFGKRIVAEFVENAETCEILRGMKVDYAQGYYIGRPSEQIPVPAPRSGRSTGLV